MLPRVRKRDTEHIYMLRMLLDSDEFGPKFAAAPLADVRKKLSETILMTVKSLLMTGISMLSYFCFII